MRQVKRPKLAFLSQFRSASEAVGSAKRNINVTTGLKRAAIADNGHFFLLGEEEWYFRLHKCHIVS